MPAGTEYAKNLNKDLNKVKTPAFYDANLDEWLMASANVVQTEGGLFIFQKGTDLGRAKTDAVISAELPAGTKKIGSVDATLTGSIVKRDTILNAVSVAAGAEQLNISLNLTGEESEVWILVNTDKQPWTLATNASNSGAIMGANISPIYPRRTNHASIYTSLNGPSTHLFYAFRLDATGTGISDPITLAEAKNLKLPPFEARFTFTNGHATDTATVTVRVLRRLR